MKKSIAHAQLVALRRRKAHGQWTRAAMVVVRAGKQQIWKFESRSAF